MKLKLMPMLAGAIALSVTATPLAVKAQQPSQPSQPVPGQAQNRPAFSGVQLTEQQQNKLAQIRSNTRAQIQKLLTPQQQNQFKAAIQSGQDRRAAFAAMNLSDAQKTQLRQIVQSANSQVEAILTPQQRQQIQQNIQQRQPGQNQRGAR